VVCSNEQLGKLKLNMNFRYGLPKSEKRAAELGRCLRNCFEAVLSLVAEPEDHGQLLRPLMQSQWAQKLMKSSADLDKNTLRDAVGQAVCTTYQVCILYRCLLQKCVKYAFGDSAQNTLCDKNPKNWFHSGTTCLSCLIPHLHFVSLWRPRTVTLDLQALRKNTSLDGRHNQKVFLSLVAPNFRNQELTDALGCSAFQIYQARLHAMVRGPIQYVPSLRSSWHVHPTYALLQVANKPVYLSALQTGICAQEHGPGIPTPRTGHTRPGRSYDKLNEVINFIGSPENLHRLPGGSSRDVGAGKILMKRKQLRSVLYRKYCAQVQHTGGTPVSESFFRQAYDRIEGVVFSDRVAMECGCSACISMIMHGWEELTRICNALCDQLQLLCGVHNVDTLRTNLATKVESARRFLHGEYGDHVRKGGVGCSAHCQEYALSTEEGPFSCNCEHTEHTFECSQCNGPLTLIADVEELFESLGVSKIIDCPPTEDTTSNGAIAGVTTGSSQQLEYKSLTVPYMQQELRNANMDIRGKKPDVYDRYMNLLNRRRTDNSSSSDHVAFAAVDSDTCQLSAEPQASAGWCRHRRGFGSEIGGGWREGVHSPGCEPGT